jgi:archaellum component FlaC
LHQHAYYEELCGLAATGQIPESEASGFLAHLGECSACRSSVEDFTQASTLLAARDAEKKSMSGVPHGMTERFIARARSRGLSINKNAVSQKRGHFTRWKVAAAVGLAASLLIAGFLGLVGTQHFSHRSASTVALQSPGPSVVPQAPASQQSQDGEKNLQRQLAQAQAKVTTLTVQMNADRDVLDRESHTLASLQAELQRVQAENAGLKAGTETDASRIETLQAEIEKLNSVKRASDIAVMTEENELRNLRQTLLEKDVVLKQQQHLIDTGAQARDLIVARNLHIIDVYDRDGEGNAQRAFGRIFYTEGKSLVFYAYDLADPRKIDQQVSFYAWGERLDRDQPVKRLGIFHNEDVNEGRWVLTFDDPNVLAQINSVFVTVEQEKQAINRPRGKRILNAFLGNKANHP